MKIVFNMLECGLGNNGGTRTIIKCVEVLEKLGHRCDIVGTVDKFTWFGHKPIIQRIPIDTDVIIATACTTVFSTLQSNVPKKAWYIRAHERWCMSNKELGKRYSSGILNIVNSKGLQRLLTTYGKGSKLVYQGVDFEYWKDLKLRPKNKIRIGCLYTKQPRKRWKDFVKLSKILGYKNYEYISVGSAKPKDSFLTESVYNVGYEKLREVYSSCHIWFAPTDSEGLHNVPMEANLCGCLVVCADEPLNGMIYDYAFNNNTAMVYERKNIGHATELIHNPNWKLIKNMQGCLKKDIGTREDNMKKMIEYLENGL